MSFVECAAGNETLTASVWRRSVGFVSRHQNPLIWKVISIGCQTCCVHLCLTICAFAPVAPVAYAQRPTQPAVRALGPIEVRCPALFRVVTGLRALSDGRVLVSDAVQKRLVLLDSMLARPRVLLDTTSDAKYRFTGFHAGPTGLEGRLIAAAADSTLFVDETSAAFLLISPGGEVSRVIAMPPPPARGAAQGVSARRIDSHGRILYLLAAAPVLEVNGRPLQIGPKADTVALLRTNLGNRGLDTLAWLRVPVNLGVPPLANPVPVNDDWAVLPDATVAVVRAADFHVDWIEEGGRTRTTHSLPFDWRHLTDSSKQYLADSLHAYYVANPVDIGFSTEPIPNWNYKEYPRYVPNTVPDSVLPDYVPPFSGYTALADVEGRVWIRTLPPAQLPPTQLYGTEYLLGSPPMTAEGGPIYDVIGRDGLLVDRIRIPGGTSIVGFGPGGVVYLVSRTGAGVELARARFQ